MEKNEYYVYALIDPRNDSIFYIGKGKGKRFNSHLNENLKSTKNIVKFSRIEEIKAENLQVKIEILFPYLTEQNALNLEKIIIYKIGRKAFREGSLVNFVPGGKWSPGDSLFYEFKPNVDFDLSLLDFVAQEKFLSIDKTSSIVHLNEIKPKYNIYKYDLNGNLVSISSIVCFFKDKNMIDLFFEINNENLPIYFAGSIYSKKPIREFYFSERLMSLNQHVFDPLFMKKLDENLKKKKGFNLELKQFGFSRIKVKLENDIFKIKQYYPNNCIQKKQYLKNGLYVGKWVEYYENGELKSVSKYFTNGILSYRMSYNSNGFLIDKIECFKEGRGRIKKSWSYFDNGNLNYFAEYSFDRKMVSIKFCYSNGMIKYTYNNFNQPIEYLYYNENGILIEKFVSEEGYIKYNLSGKIISIKNSKHMDFVDPHNVLTTMQPKSNYDEKYCEEKIKSDEDWKLYNDFLNSNN